MGKNRCVDCDKVTVNRYAKRCKKCSDKKLIKNLSKLKRKYIKILNNTKKIKNHRYWLCKCICGTTKWIRADWIKNNINISCGCKTSLLMRKNRIDKFGEQAKKELFRNYKTNAIRRKLQFTLSFKNFMKLTQQNCHYCGLIPKQIYKSDVDNGDYIYNGIDRINNKKGYTKKNVVPCCKMCNMSKYNHTKKEFLEWITRVYLYQRFYTIKHKKYSMLLGRYQVLPPHKGHLTLINTLLKEGKNVLIVLRKEDSTEKNPYTLSKRKKEFEKIFKKEIKQGKILVVEFEDVIEVCYGRTPGWGIREIRLDPEIEKISGTEIRRKK